jgi:SecD/SecF fusion protein
MLKRNLWKLVLCLALIAWAGSQLVPLKDAPSFADFAKTQATAKQADFAKLVDEAAARKQNNPGETPSEYVGLKQIGKERRIDLSREYFPHIRLEASLRNIEKRNDIVLNELLRLSKGRLQLGLDLKGGVAFTLEALDKPGDSADPNARKEKLQKAIEIIRDRINAFGVAEPVIRPIGENRIEVQLPGVSTKDNPDVVNQVKAPARLDFRMVHPTAQPGPGAETPPGYEIKVLEHEGRGGEYSIEEVYVKRIPEMTGEMISNSFARPDMYGKPEVILEFTSDGKKRFAEVTRAIAEGGQRAGVMGRLAIVLDGKLYSAPTVREEINSNSAQISGGGMTDREAINLANVLNNPLDVELKVMEQQEVGPSLAQDAIDSGVKASIIAAALVAAFMIFNYTIGGVITVVSVGMNILLVIGVLASLGATVTMPGIAGIVLTIGMAVDAHILIFERMREELNLGKSLPAAFHAGHEKAFTTIIDANLTTMIASGLMIALGTGPVKGFGVTLTIGIFATMFTALVVSRMLLEMSIDSGAMKKFVMANLVRPPTLDFLKFSKPAFIISWIIVVIGLTGIAFKGQSVYGIDFVGGDEVSLAFKDRIDSAKLRTALDGAKIGEVSPLYQSDLGGGRETLKVQTEAGRGDAAVGALTQAFPQAGFDVVGKTTIGPAIGREIQWNAFMTLGIALAGILLYIAFRFEVGYGVGAVVGTIHNVLMTIGIFVLTNRQFTAPMVAAILLIVGYSINDTIVVFDRIREEMKLNPTGTLRDLINVAIRKVFTRSILTSVTTLLAALALFVFGGGVINDLSFTFIVGVITGTFASIFIASPVFYWWHKGDRRHVEAHHDIAPKYEWQGTSKASE